MFPAPTTSAISTPRLATPCPWAASPSTRSRAVPYSRPPIRASPDSFSRTRLNAGSSDTARTIVMRALLAHHEPGETRDAHVLARLGRDLRPQVLDRLALVAVRAHMLLLEQRDLLRPLLELALDDPLDDVVGLAILTGLCFEDLPLGLECLRVDVVDGYDQRRRWRAGDVDRDLVRELPELVATGDEVGLALHLDQDANL